jgi:hypothetical protein
MGGGAYYLVPDLWYRYTWPPKEAFPVAVAVGTITATPYAVVLRMQVVFLL